jgi:hypothetical protein
MSLPLKALLMIRPARFAFNAQTAITNSFQFPQEGEIHAQADAEFMRAVDAFRVAGFTVELFTDDVAQPLPDSIFPNNWFSTHVNRALILYPMLTPNRRAERKTSIIETLVHKYNYSALHDLSLREKQGKFLEGTGSIVFDHDQKVALACLSSRTDAGVLQEVCDLLNYAPLMFEAVDRNNFPVYHTNVMMAVSSRIAVCCFESIRNTADSHEVRKFFMEAGKELVEISLSQMESFAGNMLFIRGTDGVQHVAVSSTAWNSLEEIQKNAISAHAKPIIVDIPTIERHGGGGIRCMLAELF